MPHILSMSVNPDTALRDRSCAPCNSSALAISCCGLCAFWVRIDALLLIYVMIAYPLSLREGICISIVMPCII